MKKYNKEREEIDTLEKIFLVISILIIVICTILNTTRLMGYGPYF